MEPFWIVFACVLGYLVGGVSFTRIVVRFAAPGADLSNVTIPVAGTDEPMRMTSISANTAGLVLGNRVGALIGVLDMLKAFLPTLAMRLAFPGQPYHLFTAVFVIIGHNWPIYYRFKGGRGISAIFGGLLAIDWLGALATSVLGMAVALFVLRDFALIFPISLLLIIPWMWLTTFNPWYVLYGVAANLLFALAIIPELKEVIRTRQQKRGAGSMEEMMQTNPMGRSMLSIARRMKWMK
jgi:glycerol-3-phosphate acyltransferase PlsY